MAIKIAVNNIFISNHLNKLKEMDILTGKRIHRDKAPGQCKGQFRKEA